MELLLNTEAAFQAGLMLEHGAILNNHSSDSIEITNGAYRSTSKRKHM